MEREVAWNHYSEEEKKKVFEFAEEYRKFISACKTERECVRTFVERAEAAGYLDIKKVIAEGIKLESGARVYADNNGKALAMFIVGKKPMEEGMRILGAHVDSPRMDLKQNPLLWWCEEIPVGNTSAGIAWCSGKERRKCSRGKYWR